MFTNFGTAEAAASMKMIKQLRAAGVSAEIYPENAKMKKQMGYADALKVPYVAIVGENELAENKMMLKEMATGNQQLLSVEEAIQKLS
jgi:histidyl-tRNA synthetase